MPPGLRPRDRTRHAVAACGGAGASTLWPVQADAWSALGTPGKARLPAVFVPGPGRTILLALRHFLRLLMARNVGTPLEILKRHIKAALGVLAHARSVTPQESIVEAHREPALAGDTRWPAGRLRGGCEHRPAPTRGRATTGNRHYPHQDGAALTGRS